MSTSAAAPSFMVLALAAVMVPPSSSFLKAGRREGNLVKSALGGRGREKGRVEERAKMKTSE